MCKERNQYDFMIETIKNDTLRKRVELGLKYYISQANTNKKWWEVTSVLSIMLPAFGSFLSYVATQCSDYECLPSAVMGISFVTTVVNGIITFFKYGERKTSYRNSEETIKNENTWGASNDKSQNIGWDSFNESKPKEDNKTSTGWDMKEETSSWNVDNNNTQMGAW